MFQQNKPANISLFSICMALILLASCTVVKQYPQNKPFVFKNLINVVGSISKDEKKRLELELQNYWDDSLKVRMISQFGVRTVIRNPNLFDSTAINSSITFMRSFLNSQGYYNVVLNDSIHIDTVKTQFRTTVLMNVQLGKNLTIDSLAFDFKSPDLQKIVMGNEKEFQLKKGRQYSKQTIATELDKLVTLFRRNGYYKLNREDLLAVVDTTDISLLEITLDPFEQARQIAEATERRRLNPTVDVVIRERDTTETFLKYYVGNVFYYPEARINDIPDSLMQMDFNIVYSKSNKTSKQNTSFIHFRPLDEHTYLQKGSLYNEERYFKTVNALSQLGTWNQVDIRTREMTDTMQTIIPGDSLNAPQVKVDSVNMLNFHLFLTPAQKYSISTDLEVSRNSGTILNGNLLGIANNITLRNRNVWKEAIQSSSIIRNGIELSLANNAPLQTFQSSISHTLSIPRLLAPWQFKRMNRLDAYKTVVNFSAAYTERRNFFRLRSLVGSYGYEWKKKNNIWLYKPLNVELNSLDVLPGLDSAFIKNPFLRTAFNTGYVVSQTLTFNTTFAGKKPNVSNYVRISVEEAGGLLGFLKGLNDKIYRYIKTEGEFRQLRSFKKTALAYRFFGGIGYNYSDDPKIGQSLPFFKQFVAGGPNSMRAWPLRQLGLGSSLLSDTSTSFKDRYGDIQLETNIEFRFPIATISSVKIGSAIFADIGNIWNLKNNFTNANSTLTWNRFARDIAIGVGSGLRLDFNYFLIRFDFAFKVKDPARIKNYGWINIRDFEWRNKEFEIEGADGKLLKRNNYAFQLGIGLPF
ncbi:MAG: outer membrane protein assembly factor [Chitinophagaceae bacterium]|nr:outer membrane protein assembly factor [Chitinophagaceae bacterium]